MDELNVLYQFNEKYAPYAGVSITSLFENNKSIDSIKVYILGAGLSTESINKLENLAEQYRRILIIKNTENLILQMKEWGIPAYRGSYAANMRLFLPMILTESLERILYLDADTIVNSSLSELFATNMENCPIAMVLDSLGENHKLNIGLMPDDYYFNSGVILFNLELWKQQKISEKIIEHIKAGNTNYPAPDQDLLNVVCKNNILLLDARYNMQPVHLTFKNKTYYKNYPSDFYYKKEQIEESVNNVAIYHCFRFLGEFPWHKKNKHPCNEIFDFYLKKSPWDDYKKKTADASFAIKIEKILYTLLPKCIFLPIFAYAHKHYIEKNKEITHSSNDKKSEVDTKISIITVCCNAQDTIEETMNSVLSQTYNNIEYIIVDGKSTDKTMEIVEKLSKTRKMKIISEPDNGIYDAMNKGIGIATGDYIQFLNSGDTLFEKETIKKVAKTIYGNKADIFYGNILYKYPDGKTEERKYGPVCAKKIYYYTGDCINHQSIFASRKCFGEKPFDTTYKICADREWMMRMTKAKKKFICMPFIICNYSLNDNSASIKGKEISDIESKRCVKEYFPFGYIIFSFFNFCRNNLFLKNILHSVYRLIFIQKNIKTEFSSGDEN